MVSCQKDSIRIGTFVLPHVVSTDYKLLLNSKGSHKYLWTASKHFQTLLTCLIKDAAVEEDTEITEKVGQCAL